MALFEISILHHPPLCSPATESMAEPPLSEPTLPPCSAGDVRSVEPSVAAVLPSSSDAGAEIIAMAVTVNTPQSSGQDTQFLIILVYQQLINHKY